MPTGNYGRQWGKLAALVACAFVAGAAPARAAVPGIVTATLDVPTLMAGMVVMLYVWRYRNLFLF